MRLIICKEIVHSLRKFTIIWPRTPDAAFPTGPTGTAETADIARAAGITDSAEAAGATGAAGTSKNKLIERSTSNLQLNRLTLRNVVIITAGK